MDIEISKNQMKEGKENRNLVLIPLMFMMIGYLKKKVRDGIT